MSTSRQLRELTASGYAIANEIQPGNSYGCIVLEAVKGAVGVVRVTNGSGVILPALSNGLTKAAWEAFVAANVEYYPQGHDVTNDLANGLDVLKNIELTLCVPCTALGTVDNTNPAGTGGCQSCIDNYNAIRTAKMFHIG